MRAPTAPEGNKVTQRDVGGDGIYKYTFKNKYWKDRECYKGGKKRNLASHYKNKKENPIRTVTNPVVRVIRIAAIPAVPVDQENKSLSKMKKDLRRTKNIFSTMKKKLQEIEEENSNINNSDSESAS